MQLPPQIAGFLNRGASVAAELPSTTLDTRCFVNIKPLDKPGVPREEHRYLNSRYSMWEYWNYEIRRIVLRPGWEDDSHNYDLYLLEDQWVETQTQAEFFAALTRWVTDFSGFRRGRESECPVG